MPFKLNVFTGKLDYYVNTAEDISGPDTIELTIDGVKVGEIDANGNLKIKGELSVLQTF